MSPLRWTTKSTRTLAGELTRQGHRAGADTVADLLREEGFSLQGNAKTIEGTQHPERDAQFRYINEQVKAHQGSADPVISVDTKKRRMPASSRTAAANGGPRASRRPPAPMTSPNEQLGKAIPYGVYDLAANAGWVNVGTDHDTAAFAVESIRRWWNAAGRAAYPGARRLLITADAGGSNSYRTRAWKAELAAFALQAGLAVTVCHFPPGTSKWNRIEHRLFSHITMNWRGRPLTSHEVIVNTIAATTTRTGLTVRAELDPGSYPAGVKVSDEQMAGLPLDRHDWHGDWNYTLRPESPRPPGSPAPAAAGPPAATAPAGHTPPSPGCCPRDWTQLTSALVIPYQVHREAGLHIARGGPASRKAAGGYPAALTLPEMILATILRARFRMPQRVTAELFGVVTGTIAKAERQIRPLLDQHRHVIQPAGMQVKTLAELTALAARQTSLSSREPKPRVNNLQALSDIGA